MYRVRQIFISFTPVILYISWRYIITIVQARMEYSQYAFSIPLPPIMDTVTLVFLCCYPIILNIYIANKQSKRLLIMLKGMGIYLIIVLILFSLSFGHIETTGIKYKSLSTYLMTQKTEWLDINKEADLDVSFQTKARSRFYKCVLTIQTNDQQPKKFDIAFESEQQYKALFKVIAILNQNHIQVHSHIDNNTLSKMSKEEDMTEFLHDIKNVTIMDKQ